MLIDVSNARAFLTNPKSTCKHVDEIRGAKQGLSKLKMLITQKSRLSLKATLYRFCREHQASHAYRESYMRLVSKA